MQTDSPTRRLDPGQIEVVDEAVAAILRMKTPAERIALASAAHRTARQILTARISSEHAAWTDEKVQQEVARRLTGGASPTCDNAGHAIE
jgi:Rv0078B-related antitoxin